MIKVYISIVCCLPIFFDGYYFTGGVLSALVFYLYSFLLFTTFIILGRYYLFLAIPSLVFSALVTSYVVLTRSKISLNVVASVLETDFREALEFTSSPFFIRYILISLSIIMSPYVLHRLMSLLKIAPLRKLQVRPLFILICLLTLTGFHHIDTSGNERRTINAAGINNYFPVREMITLKRILFEASWVINQYQNMSIPLDSEQNTGNDTSVILVIGEAARKSSMGLYGSKYDTTPYLSKLANESQENFVHMSQMVSASATTRVSVPSMISMSSAARFSDVAHYPSIYRMANTAGVETVYLASKAKNTFFESVINAIMQDNKVIIYNDNGSEYDGDVLDYLPEIINDGSSSQLITFQLAGSHYKYDARYPPSHDCFEPAIEEAFYLNSIRYTDFVLSRLAQNVNQTEKPYVIIYTSDHGEYVNDEGDGIFGHGFKQFVKNEVEVPLVFIFNDAFAKKYQELVDVVRLHSQIPVSHDNVSHTVLGLLGISDSKYYSSSYDITSEAFLEHERFIVDMNMKDVPIELYSFRQSPLSNSERTEIKLKPHCSG